MIPFALDAQSELSHTDTDSSEVRFRIALASLNSYVPTVQESERMLIPAWGLEFEYFIDHQWAIAGNFELELLNYIVETGEEEAISRDYPFIASLLLIHEFNNRLVLSAGYGKEFEPRKNFDLLTFTASYKVPLSQNWDLSPGITYNSRFNAYDSWSLGLAIGKSF